MNPRMITVARESRGLSQSHLSRITGVSQATLSKVENGFVDLPEERVIVIAEALQYPRSLFDWPDEIFGFGSSMFHHRKQQSLSQGLLRRIQASTNLLIGRLRRLAHGVSINAPLTMPSMDTTQHTPEAIAQAVRSTWVMPMGPVHNMTGLLEAAGVYVVRRDFGTHRMPGISVRVPSGQIVITINYNMPADRERFTLAHELGHLVMHDLPQPEEDAEREADRFASEFLMPAAEIRPQLARIDLSKAAALKQHWRTAMSAIIRRAKDLDVISESRYRSLLTHMSQKGWLKVEPVQIPREQPSLIQSIVDLHVRSHGYTHDQLAELVGLSGQEFIADFNPPPERTNTQSRQGNLRLVR